MAGDGYNNEGGAEFIGDSHMNPIYTIWAAMVLIADSNKMSTYSIQDK